MIGIIPVSRFRVKYEVAAGYPYSSLEPLVLKSVGDGLATINNLVDNFKIHPRLLIQSLVMLTHAGWIALGTSESQQFVLTLKGKRALESGQKPETTVVSQRQSYVLLERFSGAVISESEAHYISKKKLQDKKLWQKCIRFRQTVFDNKLDESQVQHLLPRRTGERLHWVGPIDMVSKNSHFVLVDIDLDNEKVFYLPRKYENQIGPYLIDEAKTHKSAMKKDQEYAPDWQELDGVSYRKPLQSTQLENSQAFASTELHESWSYNDILSTREHHTKLLNHILENAKASVFISSSLVNVECLEHLRDKICRALVRGVDIDLIRGVEAKDESLGWLKKLAYDCREKIGRIRFNHEVSIINTNMMLWDEDSQGFKGVMGTYKWLSCAKSTDEKKRKLDISIILSSSRLVSCLAWCAAALWPRGPEQNLSSIPDKWRRIAANLEANCVTSHDRNGKTTNYATIKVVQDSEHKRLFREMCNSAQLRMLIATSILDDSSETAVSWLFNRNHSDKFEYKILYGGTDMTQTQFNSLKRSVKSCNGSIQHMPGITLNAFVCDDIACISSFSFLSQLLTQEKHPREIGLVLQGTEPANQIAEHLNNLFSEDRIGLKD